MEGNDVRELWRRIIALEAKVAVLEVEDEDYEILGTFSVPSGDGGADSNASDVGPDIQELPVDDYGDLN